MQDAGYKIQDTGYFRLTSIPTLNEVNNKTKQQK